MGRAFRYQRRLAPLIVTVAERSRSLHQRGSRFDFGPGAKKTTKKTAAKPAAKKATAKKTATEACSQKAAK